MHMLSQEDLIPGYIKDLVPYPPGKPIEELKRELGIEKVIKLASNENPIGPSPKAIEAIKGALNNLHRYPDGSSYYLKERLSEKLGVTSDHLIIGNGSNELIEFLVGLLIRPGMNIIVSEPSFLIYKKAVQAVGGESITAPLKLRHDLKSIKKLVNPSTRLIFLDNPHNPTGTVLYREEFEGFLRDLPDHVFVVLDEAYMEFVSSPSSTVQGLDFIERDPRVVTLRTFSKAYGLAGLRIGYGVMDKELATYVERVRQPFNVNSLAQIGALAALNDMEHFEKTLEVTRKGKEFLTEKLTALGCKVFPSETNFIMVDLGREARGVYEAMLRDGVIIRPMNSYGFSQYIRITVGLPEENEMCIESLSSALSNFSQE